MMKIRTLIITSVILFGGHPAPAQNIGIRADEISVQGDHLIMDLTIDASGLEIKTRDALRVEPKLVRGEDVETLPAVVYSGRQRYHFDRRAEKVNPSEKYKPPYQVYTGVKSDVSYLTRYRISIPYAFWHEHSALVIDKYYTGCCVRRTERDILVADLNPIPPVAAPAPITATPSNPEPLPEKIMLRERIARAVIHIEYKQNDYSVIPSFGRNAEELRKACALLDSLSSNPGIEIGKIRLTGYASPEGSYLRNESLARNRTESFKKFITGACRSNVDAPIVTQWVAEDWDGLVRLINRDDMRYKQEVLHIIETVGLFDGREKQLMDLRGGIPYKFMLAEYFPQLRRIELEAEYRIVEEITK